MKKIVILSIIFFFLPQISIAEEYPLKLRTSYNPGYLRIVIEGAEEVIAMAIVNQKGQDIVVSFQGTNLTLQGENAKINYRKTDKGTVVFSPGSFSGLKVLNLKKPSRLVIDVYHQDLKKDEKQKDGVISPARAGLKPAPTKTLVIDPGHGGFESGIVKDDYAEKNIVLDISRKLSSLAKEGAFNSALTRGGDLYMSMSERIKYSNSRNADIFISIHIGNHKDIVIYIPVITEHASDAVKPYLYNKGQEEYLKKTVILLNAFKEAANSNLGSEAVTIRPLPYSILSKIEAAALIIELPSFEYANYTDDFKTAIANILSKGLYLYEEKEAIQ
jgi:hypothetical protein